MTSCWGGGGLLTPAKAIRKRATKTKPEKPTTRNARQCSLRLIPCMISPLNFFRGEILSRSGMRTPLLLVLMTGFSENLLLDRDRAVALEKLGEVVSWNRMRFTTL